MVLKWFQEVEDLRYNDVHAGEFDGYKMVAARPCGKHLPRVFAIGYKEVGDHHGCTQVTSGLRK